MQRLPSTSFDSYYATKMSTANILCYLHFDIQKFFQYFFIFCFLKILKYFQAILLMRNTCFYIKCVFIKDFFIENDFKGAHKTLNIISFAKSTHRCFWDSSLTVRNHHHRVIITYRCTDNNRLAFILCPLDFNFLLFLPGDPSDFFTFSLIKLCR